MNAASSGLIAVISWPLGRSGRSPELLLQSGLPWLSD